MSEFKIKDSGERAAFAGGMVRDTTQGKTNFLNVRFGPMLKRWAKHTTAGRNKYPDVAPGVPNWTLAQGVGEFLRFKESAARHFEQWLAGDRDEDHAAAVFFNINGAEYVMQRDSSIDPSLGAGAVAKPVNERAAEEECRHEGPDGWYCERAKGHDGLHAFAVEKYLLPDQRVSAAWA